MSVDVRPVRPDEYEWAGRLTVAAYEALPGGIIGDYGRLLADVANRAEGAVVLVADGAGELLGTVTYVPDASSPYAEDLREGEAGIRMLAVDPAAQGRGVGRTLVDACIDRARAEGRRGLFLSSTPAMAPAHRVYAAAGFVRTPDRDWEPYPDFPLWTFALDLGGN